MGSVDIIVNVSKKFLVYEIHMGHVTKVIASSISLFYQGNICDMTLNFILCLEVEISRLGNLVQSYLMLIKNIILFTKILFGIVIDGSH